MTQKNDTWLALGLVLVIGLAGAGPARGGPSSEEIGARLVDLGLEVEVRIDIARYNLQRGSVDRDLLDRWATEAERSLEILERRARLLDDTGDEVLARKLDAVRMSVENLRRASELGTAPPRVSDPGGPVRHLDRGRDLRSAPANDNCNDAYPIGFGTYLGDTSQATNDGQAICGASLLSPDVWFRFTLPAYGTYMVDTIGSSFDTVVSVHSGCPGTIANQIACNDDYNGLQSVVEFGGYSGNEVLIRVSGSNGAVGNYQMTLSQGGSIAGTVTETGTGDPVDTWVEVFTADAYQVGYDYTDPSTGAYEVIGIGPGPHYVATDGALDAVDEIWDDHSCPGGLPSGCDPSDGDPVGVTVGVPTTGIDFVLDSGAEITGVVRAVDTGLPVASAAVRLYDAAGTQVTSDYTDSSGVYVFRNRIAGTYYLVVLSSLFEDELYDDIPCPGGPPYGCELAQGTPVIANWGSTTTGIDFSLRRLGAVSGRVTDRATGLPLNYIDVRLYDNQGSSVKVSDTDANGEYSIGGLADGTYFVTASYFYDYVPQLYNGIDCPAGGCDVLTGTPVTVTDQSTVVGIDFDLTTRGTISGRVIDVGSAAPLAGVLVRAYNQSGSYVDHDYTDTYGVYLIDQLYTGTYFLVADDSDILNQLYQGIPCPSGCDPTTGTPVAALNGQATTGIDFAVVSKGRISGRVTAANGSGPVTMRMRLYSSLGTHIMYTTSYDGDYEFTGVDDGIYYVVADSYSSSWPFLEMLYDGVPCWDGYPEGCDLVDGTPVTASAGTSTTGIDFSLSRMGTILGTVLDAGDQSPVSGSVYVRSIDGSRHWSEYLWGGTYAVNTLYPGEYYVIADGNIHRDEVFNDVPCAGEYPDLCSVGGGTPVTVAADDEVTVNMWLDRLARIDGTVEAAGTGSGLSGYLVRLYDHDGEYLKYDYTGSDGAYDFQGIWPGTYFLATDERSLDYVDQLHDGIPCPGGPPDGCDPADGTPIVLDLATTLVIDFDLLAASRISGRVTDAQTGLTLYGVIVEAWNAEGSNVGYDSTDAAGVYEIRGLGGGTYYIASDEYSAYSLTYIDMLYDGIPCPTGPPEGCDPTKGTPVTVAPAGTTRFIDLALLRHSDGISGIVTDAATGEALDGVQIDVWDAGTGLYAGGTVTSRAGTYVAEVDGGSYVVATDNAGGWLNQIWDGIPCVGGSAFNGDCDPMIGDVVTVQASQLSEGIDFALTGGQLIFADGFETGDTSNWE